MINEIYEKYVFGYFEMTLAHSLPCLVDFNCNQGAPKETLFTPFYNLAGHFHISKINHLIFVMADCEHDFLSQIQLKNA